MSARNDTIAVERWEAEGPSHVRTCSLCRMKIRTGTRFISTAPKKWKAGVASGERALLLCDRCRKAVV